MSGRSGRWRSGEKSRHKILEAARVRFAGDGYDRATVRAIAADAGVDPSMISYFFGGKDKLFAAVLEAPGSPREPVAALLAHGVDGAGAELVRRFLQMWDAGASLEPILTLTMSAGSQDPSARMLREFIDKEFTAQVVDRLEGPDAAMRGALVTAQLMGLAVARYAVRVEPIASAGHDAIVTWAGPIVQAMLDGTATPDRTGAIVSGGPAPSLS
ncbi:TetR family transcriptional regulator [Nonomuraea sp. NPDC050547]|uniref:TetR/AcrR family transcriptional regulator n=1 Tax=Nonomuraea sp. NPDC050547 TaxID=3364368 RepID=UPI0037A4C180